MLGRIKQYIWIGLAIAAFYFLLSHHFIFFSLTSFSLLQKNELTLKYTFYSLQQNSPEQTLRVEALRDAGIAELMLEKGMVTDEKLNRILQQIDSE